MEYKLYNQKAENIGKVDLPDDVFALSANRDLLHQVVTSQMSNKRQNIAHTKDRGEVKGGGKKPWRQKGTGRARHGSIRSPIWKGGGVTFGPRKERNFERKINKKMARKALFVALSLKAKDKEIVVLDNLNFDNWKTKEMAGVMKRISELFPVKHGSVLVITPGNMAETVQRVAKNLPKVDVMEAKNLNALNVLARKNLLVFKDSIDVLNNSSLKN